MFLFIPNNISCVHTLVYTHSLFEYVFFFLFASENFLAAWSTYFINVFACIFQSCLYYENSCSLRTTKNAIARSLRSHWCTGIMGNFFLIPNKTSVMAYILWQHFYSRDFSQLSLKLSPLSAWKLHTYNVEFAKLQQAFRKEAFLKLHQT